MTPFVQRDRAVEALRESEARLAAILDSQDTYIVRLSLDGRLLYQNDACRSVLGAPAGDGIWAAVHPQDRGEVEKHLAELRRPPYRSTIEVRMRIGGESRTVRWQSSAIRDARGEVVEIQGMGNDVTERMAAERRASFLNTLYGTLSAVNHAIVQSRGREQLGERIVRLCTEIGIWHGAWIGFAEPAMQRIVPQAWSASLAPYIGKMNVSIDPAIPEGRGPTGNAVRTGVPYFCNDVFADPATAPWRGFASAFGVGTVAAIPLLPEHCAPGVVNLYSREKEIYTPEVRALVIEMGDDITFALDTMEMHRQRLAAEAGLASEQAKLRRSLEATVEAIAATLETRDPYTAGHQRRVAELATAIAREMGLDASRVEGIHFGALIHDLGKIQVPAEILAKPTRLSKVEFELIKTHPQAGYEIVKGIDFPWPVADMVHQHHERLDGSGYPQGLKGDAIVLEARILAVADVVEAMASHRPYRPARRLDEALKEVEAKRGAWFDPAVVDACLRLFREKAFAFSAQ